MMKRSVIVFLSMCWNAPVLASGFLIPVEPGVEPPPGVYYGMTGGYSLYLTVQPSPLAVALPDDEPLYVVSSRESPVVLPPEVELLGHLPDGSVVCILPEPLMLAVALERKLDYRLLMPLPPPLPRREEPRRYDVDPRLLKAVTDEVDVSSIGAFIYDLTSFRTRYAGTEGNAAARIYLAEYLSGLGYEVEVEGGLLRGVRDVKADGELVALSLRSFDGEELCLFSTDGGLSFDHFHPRQLSDPYHFTLGGNLAVFAPDTLHFAAHDSYYRSTDAGETWIETRLLEGYDTVQIMRFADSRHGYIISDTGGQFNDLFATEDGGDSWEQIAEVGFLPYELSSLPGAPETLLASGRYGNIFRSADGGRTWEMVEQLFGEGTVRFAFEDGSRGMAASSSVLVTEDGGVTWSRVGGPSKVVIRPFISVVSPGPGEYLLTNPQGRVWYTPDRGETWTDRSPAEFYYLDGVALAGRRLWLASKTTLGYSDDLGLSYRTLPDWLKGELPLGFTLANVVGERRGLSEPDSYVYLCAHFDSVSEIPRELAPGANDNGSGASALLEAARVLAPYANERTLRIAFFDAEEWGCVGSQYHAAEAAHARVDIAGVINLDMVIWSDPEDVQEDLDIDGLDKNEWLTYLLARGCAEYGDRLPWKASDFGGGSDHRSFIQSGYSAVMGIEDLPPNYPYYHSSLDDYDAVEGCFPLTWQITRSATAAVSWLAGLVYGPLGPPPTTAYAYPNPFRAERHQRVIFANLVPGSRISIYDAAGSLLFEDRSAFDTYDWAVVNQAGAGLASGVYLYRVSSPGGEVETGKLAVLR